MKTNIKDFKAKESISSSFIVKYIAVMEGKDGRSYLNLILADKTGELECRKWTDAHEVADIVDKGDIVSVTGKINLFQNRLQLIIKDISKLDPESVDISDYVAASANPPEKMLEKLDKIVSTLEDVYLKELLTGVLNDHEIRRRLRTWSAAKSIHHAYQGGLLEHTLSCTELGASLAKHYNANVSYVVAGTVLHDLCKIYELTDASMVEYTEEGKLVGHLVKSIELLDRFCAKVKNFPYAMKLHLKHILISHHGQIEFGSPKLPQTSEAMLVHLIDLMDSKMASFEAVKKKDMLPGHWSGYVKHLERLVFKEELPTFTEYLPDNHKVEVKVEKKLATPQKKKSNDEPLQSKPMADMLKGFKLE